MAAHLSVRGIARLRNLAIATGVLAGIGGLVHGVGEVLQGSRAPGGIGFESWTQGRIASNLGGEPAISVVPDLLITGILTIGASLAVVAWAARYLDHRYAGRVLAALSVLMLLVGGGIGPPVLGLLAAMAAGGAHLSRDPGWIRGRLGRTLAPAWPTLFWVCIADATFLVLGSLAVGVLLNVDVASAFVYAFLLAAVAMPLATIAGMAHAAGTLPARTRPAPPVAADAHPLS